MLRRSPPASSRSCHGDARPARASRDGAPAGSVALVGSPNVGKSSLFNALTGARRSVGNWPGTSVEVGRGTWRLPGGEAVPLLDLPGAVSLDALSPDEELTRDLLLGARAGAGPRALVVVVDAADLGRGLYLVRQVREHRLRAVLALTMLDVARRRGRRLDLAALAERVGVPVVAVDPRRRAGLAELGRAVEQVIVDEAPEPLPAPAAGVTTTTTSECCAADDLAAAEARFTWVAGVVAAAGDGRDERLDTTSDRVDRFLTSPVTGPVAFLAVMWAVFQVTTRVAAPLQEALAGLVDGPASTAARTGLRAAGLEGTWVEGLVVEGLVAGVGTVLTFVPVMALMFCVLAVLEDSGYLARAAVVTDRLMRALGLPGRAFLPLVVGFGCNVPAVSATRALPDARHRLLTTLLVPFTSCSARLTVYVLLATTFFGSRAGNVVFGLYVLSIALVVLVGLLLRSTVLRVMGQDPLVLDLPRYQLPAPRVLGAVTWTRLSDFLRTAGGVIVLAVTAVWLLSAIPAPGGRESGEGPVRDSLYGTVAAGLAPVFAPAGFGDWHAGGALVVGFVAKEAVVSSWAQTYAGETSTSASGGAEPSGTSLAGHLRAEFERSSGGHPQPAVLAFLVFLLAYTPCAATVAAQLREVGPRWTLTGLGLQLAVAWVLAVAVFQLGRLAG